MGITGSTVEDLKSWHDEVGLTTDLLSDSDRTVAMAYGAAASRDQEKFTRISVLIGADGTVLESYAVSDPAGHPSEVLADL